ncbi:MAG: MMPL family transporter [Gemmatimonadota bacterium]|nr:MMPL family transporter [Gemmatimonadota bacterium]MDH3478858.1 MMPL family transporter [Gemmatimonadota bacterium]
MTAPPRRPAGRRFPPEALYVGLAVLSILVVVRYVDLSPRVESEFFFSEEDPQLQASIEIDRRFPSPPQIIVRAQTPDLSDPAYETAIRDLTADFQEVPGLIGVYSTANQDAFTSPLWSRLLLTPDGTATNIVLSTDGTDPAVLVPRIEAVVARHAGPDLDLRMSGVPYVVEQIRRSLFRDLLVFSSAALVVFGLVIGVVYRRGRIVVGALAACLTACAVTLSLAQLAGIAIGLLTANITTIVFVITLSHVVFLTSNWQATRSHDDSASTDPVARAMRLTIVPSFWCMFTTLCGFLSLLIATAEPLRELGMAGAIGTLTALAVAYGVYPPFLRESTVPSAVGARAGDRGIGALLPSTHAARWLIGIGAVVAITGLGMRWLTTDPSLLSYFARGSDIRTGLEAIDRDGGSSSLNLVVRETDDGLLDTDAAYDKMWALQDTLEADASVGVVLSPAVLLADAKRAPLAGFLDWSQLLRILESPRLGRVALSFVTPDHSQGLFYLRMREAGRDASRAETVERMERYVRDSDLDLVMVGGQYDLQAQLGRLIGWSLRNAIGGLLLLFIAVAFVVSRSSRASAVMVACLTAIPLVILGTLGHFRVPLDMIASPAVNVSLAMGVDSMIHLAVRARRLRTDDASSLAAWLEARAQLWRPILGASFIICAGFGIFSLSAFPPTQRFGLAVILGTLTAATVTLIAVPLGAGRRLGG